MAGGAPTETQRPVQDQRIRVVVNEPARVTLRHLATQATDVADLIDIAIELAGPLMLHEWPQQGASLDDVPLTDDEVTDVLLGINHARNDTSFRVVSASYGSPFTTILEFSGEGIAAKAIVELTTRLVTRAGQAYKKAIDARKARVELRKSGKSLVQAAPTHIVMPGVDFQEAADELRLDLGAENVSTRVANRLHRTIRLAVAGVVIQLDTETTRETTTTRE